MVMMSERRVRRRRAWRARPARPASRARPASHARTCFGSLALQVKRGVGFFGQQLEERMARIQLDVGILHLVKELAFSVGVTNAGRRNGIGVAALDVIQSKLRKSPARRTRHMHRVRGFARATLRFFKRAQQATRNHARRAFCAPFRRARLVLSTHLDWSLSEGRVGFFSCKAAPNDNRRTICSMKLCVRTTARVSLSSRESCPACALFRVRLAGYTTQLELRQWEVY